MAVRNGCIAKQLQTCLRTLDSFTDGQVCLDDCDWDELSYITFRVSPNDGIYIGGIYDFEVCSPMYKL